MRLYILFISFVPNPTHLLQPPAAPLRSTRHQSTVHLHSRRNSFRRRHADLLRSSPRVSFGRRAASPSSPIISFGRRHASPSVAVASSSVDRLLRVAATRISFSRCATSHPQADLLQLLPPNSFGRRATPISFSRCAASHPHTGILRSLPPNSFRRRAVSRSSPIVCFVTQARRSASSPSHAAPHTISSSQTRFISFVSQPRCFIGSE